MTPISLSSMAVSAMSLADSALNPLSPCDQWNTSIRVLRTCLVPKVDIVCIPDINEDPLQDWTQPTGSGNVNWLTDLLPLSFPDARILLFRYSHISRLHGVFTHGTIFAQSYQLLRQLWRRRRGIAERRPLVFLVHNSGVLMARSALIQSSTAIAENAHFRSIYLSTGVVVALDASKHHMSLSQSWPSVLDNAISKAPRERFTRRERIRFSEERDRSSEWFKWQLDRYRAIAPTIMTTTIIVKRDPRIRSATGQRLLAAATAYRNKQFLGDHARVAELEKEGFSLTQYGSASEAAYQDLVKNISDSMEIGVSLSKAKWTLDNLQKSFSFTQNDEWVAEAQKEYNRQLEHSAAIEHEWLALLEPIEDTRVHEIWRPTSQKGEMRLEYTPDPRLKQIELAEQLMRRVEGEYGSLHARTLECLNTLVERNIEVRMFDKAEGIMKRLLVSWERAFGPQSPKFLWALEQLSVISLQNFAWCYGLSCLTKAIDIRLKLRVGLDHKIETECKKPPIQRDPELLEELAYRTDYNDYAIAMDQINLAASYDTEGRYREAELLYTEVLHSQVKQIRLLCLETQGDHWRKTGELAKAAANFKVVLEAYDLMTPPVDTYSRRALSKKLTKVELDMNPNLEWYEKILEPI